MTKLISQTAQINGVSTRIVASSATDATPIVFLHGGSPGVTPYCGGAHLWGGVLEKFAMERQVLAPDLPGSGGTALDAGVAPTFENWGAVVVGLLREKQIAGAHLVGHEEGGLLALWMALHAPEFVRSLTIVASKAAAPAGDSLPIFALSAVPRPRWSAVSQRWAFEQISYSAHHIDDELISDCTEAAQDTAHQGVLATLKGIAATEEFGRSSGKTKAQLFRTYRDQGIPAPVQLVWGSHDPLTSVERGFGLYELIARKQRMTEMDVVNRTGNLPFREEPQAFLDLVCAFHEAVDARA
jgi:2-hydroxy-6-oxonona-2,4-dienedioate hydrolase